MPFQPAGGETADFTPAAGGFSGLPNLASGWGGLIVLLMDESSRLDAFPQEADLNVPVGSGDFELEELNVATLQSLL